MKNKNAIKNNVGQDVLWGCEGAAFKSAEQWVKWTASQDSNSNLQNTTRPINPTDERSKTTETQKTNSQIIYALKGVRPQMMHYGICLILWKYRLNATKYEMLKHNMKALISSESKGSFILILVVNA